VRLNVVGNHGGLPCELIYGSFSDAAAADDDDELENFSRSIKFLFIQNFLNIIFY